MVSMWCLCKGSPVSLSRLESGIVVMAPQARKGGNKYKSINGSSEFRSATRSRWLVGMTFIVDASNFSNGVSFFRLAISSTNVSYHRRGTYTTV